MASTEVSADSGTKINLSMLVDFLLQKTYHDLTVLSELLPRKSDIERKIEIVQFASKTRQQFVRLLALVKWAASADRVDKCQAISTILDKQSMLFVDTADMLARMSRETLVKARLPTFCLPAAVDVLTGGTYPRLPTCIRDKIVPPDPITTVEKTKTLQRLNQVIQHRLVTSKLPPEMGQMIIADGRVKFRVEHEFEVMLTLMGDDSSIPWRVLSIDFLVQDMETGDGKSLVHALQTQYIHQLVQSRLFAEENPLVDLYKCLHSFCLSLQLQVLHFQAKQLMAERWGDNIRIEEYAIGKTLVVSYWRNKSPVQQGQKTGHKITICEDSIDDPTSLCVQHSPALPFEFNQDCISKVIPGDLYIEKLLTHTIKAQSNVKLKGLLQMLMQDSSLKSKVTLDDFCPSLVIQVMPKPTPAETLIVTVGNRNGIFQVSLGSGEDNAVCTELENTLNTNLDQFLTVLRDARCQLYVKRYMKSTVDLPVTVSSSLPVVNLADHKLSQLSKHKLFIQFRRHPSYCLVVEVLCNEDSEEAATKYHLLKVKPTFGDEVNEASASTDSSNGDQKPQRVEVKKEGIKSQDRTRQSCDGARNAIAETKQKRRALFLTAGHMVTLNAQKLTDYAGTPLEAGFLSSREDGEGRKRKLDSSGEEPHGNKKLKTLKDVLEEGRNNSTYDPTMGHVIAICHARMPFVQLREELSRHKIIDQGLTSEAGVGFAIRLSNLPLSRDCDASLVPAPQPSVLDCVLRLPDESQGTCLLEMIMDNCPLEGLSTSEKGPTRHVLFEYKIQEGKARNASNNKGGEGDSDWAKLVVGKLLNDWYSVCKLYRHAVELDTFLKDSQSHFRHMCRVYSYNYKQLTLQYDPDKQSLVTFEWSVEQSQFVLTFGYCGSSLSANPHSYTARHLQQEFNTHQNLPYIVQILHETFRPLSALAKLSNKPVLGIHVYRPLTAWRKFTVLPQSSTHVLLVYRNSNATEIRFQAKNLVAIRDASYSVVDPSKGRGLPPTPNLKVFLQMYVDDVAKTGGITSRNASTTDDEAPPSPINMETDAPVIEAQFTSPQPVPGTANLTASPMIPRTSPQAPAASVNVPSPFSASPNVHSPGNIYGVGSPGSWPMSPQFTGSGQGSKYRPSPTPQPMPSGTGLKQPTTPPRPLTARTWAATVPTILSHKALIKLCTPVPVPCSVRHGPPAMVSPLERFLCCMQLKRYLTRIIQDELLSLLRNELTNGLAFKTNQPTTNLQYFLSIDPSYTALRLNVKPPPGQESSWKDELSTLERFFETRVACPPYKTSALTAFARLLCAPANILRDCIKIMKLELNHDPNVLKWRVEWCLSIPPNGPEIAPPGTPAVVLKGKMLFFIQLSKPIPSSPTGEEQTVVVPILHDIQNNTTQQADAPRQASSAGSAMNSSHAAIVNSTLRRWNEITPRTGECTIFPAVLELARNLDIPL
ncbi:mediator of RNA polymerase II transcription subunit 14-like isoform X3 [Stylophora pistillata]|uniref:mediator of RNA polymerase II transcription subunit 14-like isoform X3 n=1 Tax=Stylophora pistillata TaxID=50429 RepID=UPI000C039790|nr:mediator of RNA polymerase II transcription subunit 14-like isoform X3 [Stylophora pistillata]